MAASSFRGEFHSPLHSWLFRNLAEGQKCVWMKELRSISVILPVSKESGSTPMELVARAERLHRAEAVLIRTQGLNEFELLMVEKE